MWWSANALNSFSSFFINSHTLKLKTQEIFFSLSSNSRLCQSSYQTSNQHSDNMFTARPPKTMSKFMTCSQISRPLRLFTFQNWLTYTVSFWWHVRYDFNSSEFCHFFLDVYEAYHTTKECVWCPLIDVKITWLSTRKCYQGNISKHVFQPI